MASVDDSLWGNFQIGTETSKLVKTAEKSGNDLDKDAFLKLLITQLQYQDPLDPQNDKEFIAQMAQFSALEQMQNLNKSMSYSQSFALIGKTVMGRSYNEATGSYKDVSGRVDSVSMKNGEPYLTVGEEEMALKYVTNVYEDYYSMAVMQAINNNILNQQNVSLIGKTIQAITVDENKNPTGYVEGVVEYVKAVGGQTVLVVGNKEISTGEVISISGEKMLIGKEITVQVYDSDAKKYIYLDGEITGLRVTKDSVYVQVGGYEAKFDKIDKLTDALRYVGETVMADGKAVTVNNILVKSEKIYVQVVTGVDEDGNEVKKDYLFDDVRPKGKEAEEK